MSKKTPTAELPIPLPGAQPETGQWRSMAFSFVLHLILMLAVLGFTYSSGGGGESTEPDRSAGIVLTVQTTTPDKEKYLDPTELTSPEAFAESASTSASSQTTQDSAPEIEANPSTTEIDLPGLKFDSSFDASQMTTPGTQGITPSNELSDAAREIMAADLIRFNAQKPAGPATSVSVFGTGQLEGRSFLFLLDRSTSMGSKGLGVVQIARKELTSAVENLKSHHRFQILGYNNATTPMKASRLLNASAEHKSEVPKFIANMTAFGPTNHATGIISALSYKPDVIVMLTDGGSPGLNEQQLKTIRSLSRNRTQIHCVQFGLGPQRHEDDFMGILAAQNRGTFRYVDVNEWRR